ncbi:transcriptional regulator [Vibrio cholerae]|nr:transcriptional regulator [Vibrio cholerae]
MSKSVPIEELDKLFTTEELAEVEYRSRSLRLSLELVELMHQTGKTRQQLLNDTGLTENDLQQIERSGFDISISVLEKYVNALGGKLQICAETPTETKKLYVSPV